MTRWEYTSVGALTNDGDKERELLNDMGKDGWEMVGLRSVIYSVHHSPETRFYFKRPAADT